MPLPTIQNSSRGGKRPTLTLPTPILPTAPFAPSSLPGLFFDWHFDEGHGSIIYNHAASTPLRSGQNLFIDPEGPMSGSGGYWQSTNPATGTGFGFTAPDGSASASRLVVNASLLGRFFSGTYSYPVGTYTFSAWVKSNSGADQVAQLGLDNGGTNYVPFPVPAAAGWIRISRTITAATWTTIFLTSDGVNAADLLWWGAKIEVGSVATAYQPARGDLINYQTSVPATWSPQGLVMTSGASTQAAMATWAAPGVSLSQGSFYTVVSDVASSNVLAFHIVFRDPDASSAFFLNSASNVFSFVNGAFGGATIPTNDTLASPFATVRGASHVIAFTCDGSRLRFYMDGLLVSDAPYTGTAFTLRRLLIGGASGGIPNGTVSYMAGYTQGHSPAQALQMTTYLKSLVVARGVTVETGTRQVVYEGDSITVGLDANTSTGYAALATQAFAPMQANNFAVGGQTVNQAGAQNGQVNGMFNPNMRKNIMSVFFGANDLIGAVSEIPFLTLLKAYCAGQKAVGWLIVINTVLARAVSLGGAAEISETVRTAVNTEIRNPANIGVYWDVVSDFASDATMGVFAYTADATHCADGTHPTAAGHLLLAPYNQAALQTLLAT